MAAERPSISFEDLMRVAAGQEATALSRLGLGQLPEAFEAADVRQEDRAKLLLDIAQTAYRGIALAVHPDTNPLRSDDSSFRSVNEAFKRISSDPEGALREQVLLEKDSRLSVSGSKKLDAIQGQFTDHISILRGQLAEVRYEMPYFAHFGVDPEDKVRLRFRPSISDPKLPGLYIRTEGRGRAQRRVLVEDDYEHVDMDSYEVNLSSDLAVSANKVELVSDVTPINPSLDDVPEEAFDEYRNRNSGYFDEVTDGIRHLFSVARIIGSYPDEGIEQLKSKNDELTLQLVSEFSHSSRLIDQVGTIAANSRVLDELSPIMEKPAIQPAFLIMGRKTDSQNIKLGVVGRYTVIR